MPLHVAAFKEFIRTRIEEKRREERKGGRKEGRKEEISVSTTETCKFV
jgi:hypothetical protein